MQNAEILWKIPYQIPFIKPILGQKYSDSKTAPAPSTIRVPNKTNFVIFTIPPICGADIEFCIKILDDKPIFLLAAVINAIAIVIKPMPPI